MAISLRPSDASLAQFAKSYAAHRPIIQRGLTVSFILYVLGATYKGLSVKPSASKSSPGGGGKSRKGGKPGDGKAPKVAVDAVFYERLSTILKIVIPGIRSKEALLLLTHTSLLIFRTAISLYVAALDGKCVNVLQYGVVMC